MSFLPETTQRRWKLVPWDSVTSMRPKNLIVAKIVMTAITLLTQMLTVMEIGTGIRRREGTRSRIKGACMKLR